MFSQPRLRIEGAEGAGAVIGMRGAVGKGTLDFGYAMFVQASDNIAMPGGRFYFLLSLRM